MKILNEQLLTELFDSDPVEYTKEKLPSGHMVYDFDIDNGGKPAQFRVRFMTPIKDSIGVEAATQSQLKLVVFGRRGAGKTKYTPIKSLVKPYVTMVTMADIIKDYMASPMGKKTNGLMIKFQPKIYKKVKIGLPRVAKTLIKKVKYLPMDIDFPVGKAKYMFFVRKGKNPSDVFQFPGLEGSFDGYAGDDETGEVEDIYVSGFSWDSKDGKKVILGDAASRPEGWLEIEVAGGAKANQFIHKNDIASEVSFDKKQFEAYKKMEDEAAESEAEKEAEKAEYEDVDGFTDGMTDLKKGQVLKVLNKDVFVDSEQTKIKYFVRRLVGEGRFIGSFNGNRTLENDEGMFRTEKDITKIGMDYAEYLIKKRDAKAKKSNLEMIDYLKTKLPQFVLDDKNKVTWELSFDEAKGNAVYVADIENPGFAMYMATAAIKTLYIAFNGTTKDVYFDISADFDSNFKATETLDIYNLKNSFTELFTMLPKTPDEETYEDEESVSVEYEFISELDATDFYNRIDEFYDNGDYGDYLRNGMIIKINNITKSEQEVFDDWFNEYDNEEEDEVVTTVDLETLPKTVGKFTIDPPGYNESEVFWVYEINKDKMALVHLSNISQFVSGAAVGEINCYVYNSVTVEKEAKRTFDVENMIDLKVKILNYQDEVDTIYAPVGVKEDINDFGIKFSDLSIGDFVQVSKDAIFVKEFSADMEAHDMIGVIDSIPNIPGSDTKFVYINVAYGGGEKSENTNSLNFNDIMKIVDEPKKSTTSFNVGDYVKVTNDQLDWLPDVFRKAIAVYGDVMEIMDVKPKANAAVVGVPYDKTIPQAVITLDYIVDVVPAPAKPTKPTNPLQANTGDYVKVDSALAWMQDEFKNGIAPYGYVVEITEFDHITQVVKVAVPYDKTIHEEYIDSTDIVEIVAKPEPISSGEKESEVELEKEYIFKEDREFYASDKGFAFMKAHNFIATVVMVLDDDMVIVKTNNGKQSAVAKTAINGNPEAVGVDTTEATVEESETGEVVFKQGQKSVSFTQAESIELKTWLSKQV